MPAQVLTKDEWDDPVPAILVPPKLTVECTGNEVSDAEREPVHIHLRFKPAIAVFPDRRRKGR
jgi:hypothetical protein